MATETLAPDVNNVVTFRKSIYDDDADALSLDAVEVVQSNLTQHDPAQEPAWLTYTTTTEETAEGPQGSRTYLHVDFSIDTDNLADNDTHFIRIAASDGPNAIEQVFRFMKGNLQMNSITGCVVWIKPEKEDPRPAEGSTYDPVTNFGTGADFSTPDGDVYRRDVAMGVDGALVNDGIIHSGPLLSTTDAGQPYSLFVCANARLFNGTEFFAQRGATNDIMLYARRTSLTLIKHMAEGDLNESASTNLDDEELVMIEFHKRPDGTLYIFENGTLVMTALDPEPFGGGDFILEFGDNLALLLEAAVFEADLTNAQVEAVRKRFFQSYPNLNWQALTATQFA